MLRSIAVVAAALLAVTGPREDWLRDDWLRVGPGLELAFPRDHGSHPGYRTEWWYLTGQVEDEDGRRFGLQFTVFRQGVDAAPLPEGASGLRLREIFAAHVAVVDVEGGRTVFAERLRRGGSPLAGAARDDMDVFVDDWSLRREANDRLRVDARDPASGMGLRLVFDPLDPLVLHGDDGYSAKGGEEGNASAYVSWPRLAVEGALVLDGESRAVQGEAWFDHEFGSSVLGEDVVGWDWFGLHLDDGRELMLFHLRRADGGIDPASAGTLVETDGTTRKLGPDAFRIESTRTWPSPRSGAAYPAGWTLAVPDHGVFVEARPLVADCELATGGSTGVVYWEGPVELSGSVTGRGYAELTGYAGSMGGRF